jgi:hypothetical protein
MKTIIEIDTVPESKCPMGGVYSYKTTIKVNKKIVCKKSGLAVPELALSVLLKWLTDASKD